MQLIDRLIHVGSALTDFRIQKQPLPCPRYKRCPQQQYPGEDPFDAVKVPTTELEPAPESDARFLLPHLMNWRYPYLPDESIKECSDPILKQSNYYKAHLCIRRRSFLTVEQRRAMMDEMYGRYPASAFQIPYLNYGNRSSLSSSGVGPDSLSKQVNGAVAIAISSGGDSEGASAVLEKNVIAGREDEDISPIHMASGTGNRKVLLRMLRMFDVNFPDREGRTPLIYAVIGNDGHTIDLLYKHGANLNCTDFDGRSAVHWAAYYGRVVILKQLIRLGAHPRMHDNEGRTALHWSTGNESTECLEYLLRISTAFDLNEPDNELMTCVHWTCFHNHSKHLKLILKRRGVDILKTDVEGKTPLHWCAPHKDVTCAKILIELDSDIAGIADIEYRTALHLACAENNLNLVQLLFSCDACDINAADATKRTPLHWSSVSGHHQLVNLLLDAAAVDSTKDKSGATPLHYACTKNHSQCVAAFMSRRNLCYLPDDQGKHPLIWAVVKGHVQTVRVLLENHVNCNFPDNEGNTALHVASFAGQTHCIALLLEYGSQVDTVNAQNHTPLFNCVEKGYAEIASMLIQAGSNVNQKDGDDRAPIHYASLFGHLPALSILISNHAEIMVKDAYGKTPLHCGAFNGHNEVVKYLIESGADVNVCDSEQLTPLHWAALSGKRQTVELLMIEGADPNSSDRNFYINTPLDITIEANQTQCIDILKLYGAKTHNAIRDTMATRIQKSWRGFLGRKLFTASMRSDMISQRQKRNKAALVIQRFIRRHMKHMRSPELTKSQRSLLSSSALLKSQRFVGNRSSSSQKLIAAACDQSNIEQILQQKEELEHLQRETEFRLRELSMELKKFSGQANVKPVATGEYMPVVDTFELPVNDDDFAVTMSTAEREYFQMQQNRRLKEEQEQESRRER